jgi:hypothetical protein
VYLERPWFGTGADERLAVVTAPSSLVGWQELRPFISEWGADPLFASGGRLPADYLIQDRLLGTSEKAGGLYLPQNDSNRVDVAAYPVGFDAELDLWYADIAIDPGDSYFPFIKLALARYQPYSIEGFELSSVVVADLVQIAPDRIASISKSADGTQVSISVAGQAYANVSEGRVRSSIVMVRAEQRVTGSTDAAWVPVGSDVALTSRADGTRTIWSGQVTLPSLVSGTEYRLLVREYERWSVDDPKSVQADRLVYAEAIAVR